MADAPRRSSRVVKRVIAESSESEEEVVPIQPKRTSSRTTSRSTSSKLAKQPVVESNGLLSKFGFQKKKGMSHVEEVVVSKNKKQKVAKKNLKKTNKSDKGKKRTSKKSKVVGARSSTRAASSKVSYVEASEDDFNERVSSSESDASSDDESEDEEEDEEEVEVEEEEEEEEEDDDDDETPQKKAKKVIREGSRVNIFYEDDWYKGEIIKELSNGYRVKYDLDGTFSVVDSKNVKLLKSDKNNTQDLKISSSGRLIKKSSLLSSFPPSEEMKRTKSTRKARSCSTKNDLSCVSNDKNKDDKKKSGKKSKKLKKKGKKSGQQNNNGALEDTDDEDENGEEEEEEEDNDDEMTDNGEDEEGKKASEVVSTTNLLSDEYRQELVQEGWTFDHPLIGKKTRRLFRASTLPVENDENAMDDENDEETHKPSSSFFQKKKKEDEEAVIADGVLVAFLAAEGEDPPLWKNYHMNDGEVEDLEYHEVKQAHMNHRLKLKKPRGGIFAGDNEINEEEVIETTDGIPYKIESSKIKALEAEGWIFRTSKNFLWYPSLGKYVGSPTRRFFRQSQNDIQEFTDGVVVAFLLPNSDDPVLFKNYHMADGELEDLEINELRVARLHHNEAKEKLVGVNGGVGFYDVLYADDVDDDEYDGDPREDDKWYAAIESEDLSSMPSCFVSGDPLLIQSIAGSHSATALGWHKLLKNYATTKIGKDGSVFTARIVGPDEECAPITIFDEDDDVEEEDEEAVRSQLDDSITIKKFLVKWKNVSHLHISWESASSLRRVFGARAKSAMSTFMKNQEDFLDDYGVHLCTEEDEEETVDTTFTSSLKTQLSPMKQQQPVSEQQNEQPDISKDDDDEQGKEEGSVSSKAMVDVEPTEAVEEKAVERVKPKKSKRFFVNPNWLIAERVLDISDLDLSKKDPSSWPTPQELVMKKSKHKVLVKWNALPYSAATWEYPFEVPNSEEGIQKFYDRETQSFQGKTRTGHCNQKLTKEVINEALPNQFENGGALRDYQRDGVTWMLFNWHRNRSSLLADEMGLGKTLQTVTYLEQLHEQYNLAGPFLVVAPLSTLSHWLREFERWTHLNAAIYTGSAEDRALFRQHEFYLKRGGKQNKFRVLITSFEGVTNSEAHFLRNIKWSVLVVDEAHRLKNVQSKFAQALRVFEFQRSLLLTGTPLQNNTQEFWSLLNFLDPISFQSEQKFTEEFGELTQKEQLDALTAQTSKFMLRRMKEDVEKSVPPKEETRVMVELTLLQKKYYRALYEKNLKALIPKGKKTCDGPSLMNVAMQLRKCCNHPFLLKGIRDEVIDQHADKIRNPSAEALKEAGGCMSQARSNLELECLIASSGKLVFLDKLLPKMRKEGHRVLIFSQFKIMLNILEEFLYGRNIEYERLDGDVTGSDRQMSIDRFQDPNSKSLVMLLSTKAGGCGINLVAADTVVIFDSDFNPQNDLQAQSRCHRIGQTRAVTVYRLLCDKTYEMKMIERASHKLALDKAVLGSHGTQTQLSKKEVERLLKQGAYDFFSDQSSDETSIKFCEATIDDILKTKTSVVRQETVKRAEGTGSNAFASAVFDPSVQQQDDDEALKEAKKKKQEAELDVDDPNFWTALGLIAPEDDEVDLDSLERLAEKKARAKRKERKNYNESQLGNLEVVDNDKEADYSDDFDDDDDDMRKRKKKTVKRKKPEVKVVKRWISKEVRALSLAITQHGIGDVFNSCFHATNTKPGVLTQAQEEDISSPWVVTRDNRALARVCQEVRAAAPKDKTKGGGQNGRWSEDEVAEMACWLLFTYMLVIEKPAPKAKSTPITQQPEEGNITSTEVATVEENEEETTAKAEATAPSATSSPLCSLGKTPAATKVVHEEKITFESLLEDYPWCRNVMAALCYYVDKKYKPTPVTAENTAEVTSTKEPVMIEEIVDEKKAQDDTQTKTEGVEQLVEEPAASEDAVEIVEKKTIVDDAVELGPLATQFYPLLSNMKKGGQIMLPIPKKTQDQDGDDESKVLAEDLKTVLMRHIPEAFLPATSTPSAVSAPGSFNFGVHSCSITISSYIAKKNLKIMDEMWSLSQVFKLMGQVPHNESTPLIEASPLIADMSTDATTTTTTRDKSPNSNMTFARLIGYMQSHPPASFWTLSHDEALMRSVNKHGLPSTQRKHEISCSDETIAWPEPLDMSLGFNGSKDAAKTAKASSFYSSKSSSLPESEQADKTSETKEEEEKNKTDEVQNDIMEVANEEVVLNETVKENDGGVGSKGDDMELDETNMTTSSAQPFPKRDLMIKRIQAVIKLMKKYQTDTLFKHSAKQTSNSSSLSSKSKRVRDTSSTKTDETKSSKKMNILSDQSWLQSFNKLPSAKQVKANKSLTNDVTDDAPILKEKEDVTVDFELEPEELPEAKKLKTTTLGGRSWVDSFNKLPSASSKLAAPKVTATVVNLPESESPLVTNDNASETQTVSPNIPSSSSSSASITQTPITVTTDQSNIETVEKLKLQKESLPKQPAASTEKNATEGSSSSPPPLKKAKTVGAKPKGKVPSSAAPQRSIASFFTAKPKNKLEPPPTTTTNSEENSEGNPVSRDNATTN